MDKLDTIHLIRVPLSFFYSSNPPKFTGGGGPYKMYNIKSVKSVSNFAQLSKILKCVSTVQCSVIHISIHPSKELCSKMDPEEVGVSLPWWCHILVLPPPGLFLNLIIFSYWKNGQFQRNFRSNLKVLNFSNFTLWN